MESTCRCLYLENSAQFLPCFAWCSCYPGHSRLQTAVGQCPVVEYMVDRVTKHSLRKMLCYLPSSNAFMFFGVTHDRKGWAIPSALAQCELEGFGWTWSSSGVSDCAFPISLNVFGIVAVVLDSLKPRHHGKVPYPRRGY